MLQDSILQWTIIHAMHFLFILLHFCAIGIEFILFIDRNCCISFVWVLVFKLANKINSLLKADLPSFVELPATFRAKMNERTNRLSFGAEQKISNAKPFFKNAIDWYNDLPHVMRRHIPKKHALITTIKTFLEWVHKRPNGFKSFRFKLYLNLTWFWERNLLF